MNSDSYKIIISLSHQRISFEYWQRDGENKLVPMPNGNWPAPLAFFCSDRGIIIGEDASRAAHAGTACAYENYFEQLVNDTTYEIGGQSRPIRFLLLDASEMIFHEFFKIVLLNRFGSLSDNRANMPLTIVCESDIQSHERALLQGLFRDSGYSRVRVVNYDVYIDRYIKETISKEYDCDNVLVTWTEGENLTFSLFDVNSTESSPRASKNYKGLGVDPRKEYVENLIWESIIYQNQFLQKNEESDALSKAAIDFLSSSAPLLKDTVLLSDGHKYHYSLNRQVVDCISGSNGVSLNEVLCKFLNENGIPNRSRTLLLLRGIAAENTYFKLNLSQGFSKTLTSDHKLRNNTMHLIIAEEVPLVIPGPNSKSGSTPKPTSAPKIEPDTNTEPHIPTVTPDEVKRWQRKWRQVKAEADGKVRGGQVREALQIVENLYTECRAELGSNNLLDDINAKIELLNNLSQIKPVASTSDIKNFERKWRQERASARGKVRNGSSDEAIRLLNDFINTMSNVNGTEHLIIEVKNEITSVEKEIRHKATSTIRPNTTQKKCTKDETRIGTKPTQGEVTPEGDKLVAQGKLREAREWYRTNNDSVKARIVADIIRTQKAVDVRKQSLEECIKTKDKDQINRIINEIESFIGLCQKVGYKTTEYTQLLKEYRKIKY